MSIGNEIIENEKYWNDLLFTICNGSAIEINSLKKYDIFDVFAYIDNVMKKK